jgi:hypothetical protein
MTVQFRSLVKGLLVSAVLAFVASATANAATIQMRAWLNGAQVPLAVGGTGIGTVTFDTVSKLLTWSVTYQGLSGDCSIAHFHGPAPAGVDNIPTVLMMPCTPSPMGGSATLNPTQEAELLSGQWYINIHTGLYPNGEIRGQVMRVLGDFDGDGRSDVLWRNFASGENYLYPMNGLTILGTEGYLRTVASQDWKIKGIGDFNGDGKADVFWRNATTGESYVFLMDGASIIGEGYLRTVADPDWSVARVADFNGDGKADILWYRESTGETYIYMMDGLTILPSEGYARTVADLNWYPAGAGDFNGDGRADILWRNDSTGETYVLLMDGLSVANEGYLRTVANLNWDIAGVADFDGDGRADILWRNFSTGENYLFPMAGLTIRGSEGYVRTVADLTWHVVGVGDYDGDGRADILWRNEASGQNYFFPMDGLNVLAGEGYLRTVADQEWSVIGVIDYEDEGGSSGPSLRFQFGFQHGTFGGGTTGLLDYPPSTFYGPFFTSGTDTTPPASVFFTGPMGSPYNNTESSHQFVHTNGASFSTSSVPGMAAPGGLWTVTYEGQDIEFTLPDPDSANRAINIVPTVTLAGDSLTQVAWQYRSTAGAEVPPPVAFAASISLRVDGLVAEQVVRVYDRQNIPVATTSHVLTAPVSWSAVTMIQLVMLDNLGNEYTSFWSRALPPAPFISNINPTSGLIGSQVTITGLNFGCSGCVGGVNQVRFTGPGGSGSNGVAAVFTVDSPTQVNSTVPAGALTGPVWVQAIGGTSTSSQSFTVQ